PLTDQQKTQALNEIFNKVDLKAVNALLGTSSERFAELTGYIDNCEGAAAQMAKTMSDNLTGDMDEFSSALEGLGIAAFDKFETPMRTAVQAITDVFGELNEKLKGELGYKLENLAVQLGNIAVKAAELAIDKGIPMLVNSMEWLCDNYDTVLNVTKAVIAMIAAYKGITVLKNVTTEIHGIATALVAATTSQQAFNIALAACPWAIVGSAAIGGAVALAGYIDKQTETLKIHSETVTAIEEENAAIREQIDLLDELSETNSLEAYDTAKNELDNTISRIKENEQKIYELKKAKERIDAEVSKGMDEVTENYYSNSYTPEQLDEMDRLSQEFQDQINTLINQNNQLKTLKFEQEKTITELKPYYDSGLTGNMLGASEAEQRAMKHFGIVPEDLNQNADIELDTIEEYGRQLTDKWQLLDHQFNTGIIQTEAELYEKKKALLDEYGNSQLEEHWQYYEELYSYEKSFAEESRKLSEEWQQEQLDYLKDGYKQQLSAVKEGVSDMLSEYRAAKSELESNISGYKNKLLSVGDMFSIASETDENGNTVKTYAVENVKKQMEEMRKYHSYIKKLKASGASEGLVSELTSLDFEDGTQFGKYLSGLSETEFAKINAYYKERDVLADELSQDMYKSEAEKLNNALTSSVNQALEHLPETAQNAGRQMLKGIIEGMGDTDNDLSEEIETFTKGFTELYETALDEMDLESGFSIALSGINTYSMGQELARSFASGFNDELEKSRAEISVSQASTVLDLSSAASSAERSTSKSEKITLENMTNVTVELDGETIAKYTDKKREEKERRTG
ncbi:MAG: phage tail tape measure protein, partial [Oscillospiraceae bacterium]|nr:phage tail tape measure protein [Oscillospiraceae bacterium]